MPDCHYQSFNRIVELIDLRYPGYYDIPDFHWVMQRIGGIDPLQVGLIENFTGSVCLMMVIAELVPSIVSAQVLLLWATAKRNWQQTVMISLGSPSAKTMNVMITRRVRLKAKNAQRRLNPHPLWLFMNLSPLISLPPQLKAIATPKVRPVLSLCYSRTTSRYAGGPI